MSNAGIQTAAPNLWCQSIFRFELSELIGFFYRWFGTLGVDWHHKFGAAVGIPAFDNSGTQFFPAIRTAFHT